VDIIPVEVEWQTPLVRFRAFIPWFVKWKEWYKLRLGGAITRNGEYWMGRRMSGLI
jgi:hypothetical protein